MPSIEMDHGQVILDTSPVAFALMGPKGSHRGVYVRSGGDTLDLIGLDSKGISSEFNKSSSILKSIMTPRRSKDSERDLFIVRSENRYPVDPSKHNDERLSYMTFSWRGLASENDVEKIAKMFETASVDVKNAFDKGVIEEVEWQLAPLIATCQMATLNRQNRIDTMRVNLIGLSVVYVLAVIAVLVIELKTRHF